jgi:hypothetical protein
MHHPFSFPCFAAAASSSACWWWFYYYYYYYYFGVLYYLFKFGKEQLLLVFEIQF